jgi:hypothetical protein
MQIARRLEATHRKALTASARRAARDYFDHALAQVYFFVQTLEGWTRQTDPRAILTVLNDPAQVFGRDYLWVSAAPVLVVELAGRTPGDDRGRSRCADCGPRTGRHGWRRAAVGLSPLPSRRRHWRCGSVRLLIGARCAARDLSLWSLMDLA